MRTRVNPQSTAELYRETQAGQQVTHPRGRSPHRRIVSEEYVFWLTTFGRNDGSTRRLPPQEKGVSCHLCQAHHSNSLASKLPSKAVMGDDPPNLIIL